MQIINASDHPHNLDRTAKIVWEDRRTMDAVYSVRGGFVATVDYPNCLAPTFGTEDAAKGAIREYRAALAKEPASC